MYAAAEIGTKIADDAERGCRTRLARRRKRGQGNIHFPCSADHEQDWQPYPVDPYSAICGDHTYNTYILCYMWLNLTLAIHTYIHTYIGPDCVVMCNLINTYIHTYIHT